MNITVYHAKNPNFGYEAIAPNPEYPKDFTVVASILGELIEAKDDESILDYMFRWTNHVEEDWTKVFHRAMRGLLKDDGCMVATSARSTSVGDVIRITENDEERVYVVAKFGFDKLETVK